MVHIGLSSPGNFGHNKNNKIYIRCGSRISQRGTPTLRGAPTYYLANFSRKLHENEQNFGTGAAWGTRANDPPMYTDISFDCKGISEYPHDYQYHSAVPINNFISILVMPLTFSFRRFYHITSFYLFFFNVVLGLFSCLRRLLMSMVFGLILISRLDRCLLMRAFERFDTGNL